MTETDNPKVKEHLTLKDSQILKRIEELDDNEREFQKMFESREIKPVIIMGGYDPNSKKYQLGRTQRMSGSYSTTSAAASTLTVPVGSTYRVVYAASTNGTRNFGVQLSGVIGGQTMTIIFDTGAAAVTSTKTYAVIGASGPGFAATLGGVATPIVITNGDSLTMTDTAFVASDTKKHIWIYEVMG